jgi:hypothetical protein
VLDPTTFHAPDLHSSAPDAEQASTSALPIDITHTTPFATAQQIAGSYIAPSGAPGFNSHGLERERVADPTAEQWQSTSLTGRREGTTPVLSAEQADKVTPHHNIVSRC